MGVTVEGLSSVMDRTIFTKRGPIVKRPVDVLSGSDLRVSGPNEVRCASSPFTPSHVGKHVRVSGSPGGRNDGMHRIAAVLSPSTAVVDASLDHSNPAATVDSVCALANGLKDAFNAHRSSPSHGSADLANQVTAPFAVDATSAITLINQIRARMTAHFGLVLPDRVHVEPDDGVPEVGDASTVGAALHLVNELRARYEAHRQNESVHLSRDQANRVRAPRAAPVTGSGPLCGPFPWTIVDLRPGRIADDPSDVSVTVNGLPTTVEAVFGLLGAVVLAVKPSPGDTVLVDYDYLVNPPTQIQRLNSPEFNLNQAGNLNQSGLPDHRYRARAVLMDPADPRTVKSSLKPGRTGWKYKAIQRAYSAVLNDPTTLLLNVPTNRLSLPVLDAPTPERTVRYDPSSLPDASTDPWTLAGYGEVSVTPGGRELVVVDSVAQYGTDSQPPFYWHSLDLRAPSSVHCAFRMSASCDVYDGVHGGPGFGFSDGYRAAVGGLLLTEAVNLTSAVAMANEIRLRLSSHASAKIVHLSPDPLSSVDAPPARDEATLISLVNRELELLNRHLTSGYPVHSSASAPVSASPATDLPQAIGLVNLLRSAVNSHVESAVHASPDPSGRVGLVRQVGLLKKGGSPQLADGWECSAFDWSVESTYRLSAAPGGSVSLYAGGSATPSATLPPSGLPSPSDVDVRLDTVQQAFFGSLSRRASSRSSWTLVRVNVTPVEARLVGDNKHVSFSPPTVPEADPVAPWISVGQGGAEYVSSGKLVLDSTASASESEAVALGRLGGAYRGFLREEPILTPSAACSVEFSASVGYSTFGVGNRAAGVFLDDGQMSVHLCFLQATPTPASVTGALTEPFGVTSGDSLLFAVDDGPVLTARYSSLTSTAAGVASAINDAAGATVASSAGGRVSMTSPAKGSGARIQVVGGSVADKVGLTRGTYFGTDSRPEKRISWFGADLPDGEAVPWTADGGQTASMSGRKLRVSDSDTGDFKVYSFADPLRAEGVLSGDWKMDARMSVLSHTPGDPVSTGSGLSFCGALVSVDEGPSGKNVEVHLASDPSGVPYVNVLTYSVALDQLVSVAEFPFRWNDGLPHTYNLYASKGPGVVLVLADGAPLGTFAYGSLSPGASGPGLTFGSGGNPVLNADLRSSTSVVEWSSVALFSDSRVSDPDAPYNRFVGLYRGGDPSKLSSYYLHQVDWTSTHVYRLTRDPSSSVSLYMDGGNSPAISANYDVVALPPSSGSFLAPLTEGNPVVAFGSFDPSEMCRTAWGYMRYSAGLISLDERRVVGRQVVSQGHVIASSEHLRTKSPHSHGESGAYSSGVPSDGFMADGSVTAATVLGDWTPPVPATQDLQSRGGHVKSVTPASSVPVTDAVDVRGFIADLEDDVRNTPLVKPVIQYVIDEANLQRDMYEAHRAAHGSAAGSSAAAHASDDLLNTVTAPSATDLPTAYALLADVKSKLISHAVEPGVHSVASAVTVSAPSPATVNQAVDLIEELRSAFRAHASRVPPHKVPDPGLVTYPVPGGVDVPALTALAGDIWDRFYAHAGSLVHHEVQGLPPSSPRPTGLPSSIAALNEVRTRAPSHAADAAAHHTADPGLTVASPAATDYPSALALATELRSKLNAHLAVAGTHEFAAPASVPDTLVSTSDPDKPDPTLSSVNELLASYNAHLTEYRVHACDDPGRACALGPAADLIAARALANSLKALFNSHLSATVPAGAVHASHDPASAVTAPDATDTGSLRVLDRALWSALRAHFVRPGVHGGSVVVRLDAPDGVLYQSAKFFKSPDGDEGQTSPFSDDEAVAVLTDTITLDQVIIRY